LAIKWAALFPEDPIVAYEIFRHFMFNNSLDLSRAEEWLDRSLALAPTANAITWKAELMPAGPWRRGRHEVVACPRTGPGKNECPHSQHVRGSSHCHGPNAEAKRLLDSIQDTWLNDAGYIFPKAMLAGDLAQIDGQSDVARIQYEAALKDLRAMQATDPTDLRYIRPELWIQIGLGHMDEAHAALRANLQLAPRPYHWGINLVWWSSALRAA